MMMKRFAFILLLLAMPSLQAATSVGADKKVSRTIPVSSKDPWDVDVHGGAGFGTFTLKNGVNKSFGGLIAGLALYNESLLDNQTLYISGDFLIDQANQQVVRKGFGIGSNYAITGGKKRTIDRLKTGVIAHQNNYSISWNNRLSYDSFSSTPTQVGLETLDGSTMTILTGFGFNMFIGTQTSLGLSLMQSVMSFSASVEKSTQTSTELGFAIRSYL
ncbi:MAG: hypothetical protein EOP07_07745 [Proteobacteria bacterium]|nr:MAG: hypothetical protein EOP07_07745 [Pseudomonadota bacterium]